MKRKQIPIPDRLRKKIPLFKGGTLPIFENLPQSKAASIGRTVARFSYLEWRQAKTLYNLLGLSPKQGRLAIKLPQSHAYANMVEDLLLFLGLRTNFPFRQLYKKVEAAERARNLLAHSIYLKDGDRILIQVVRGSWELGQDTESTNRALHPQTRVVDKKFLAEQRKHVEEAIKLAERFAMFVNRTLAALNEIRRTQAVQDRRHRPQNGAIPQDQPQPLPE